MIESDIAEREEMQQYLYIRGFLITDDKNINTEKYPFYGNWKVEQIGNYLFYINNLQKLYTYKCDDKVYFIIGHAYNPFTKEYREDAILSYIADAYKNCITQHNTTQHNTTQHILQCYQ